MANTGARGNKIPDERWSKKAVTNTRSNKHTGPKGEVRRSEKERD